MKKKIRVKRKGKKKLLILPQTKQPITICHATHNLIKSEEKYRYSNAVMSPPSLYLFTLIFFNKKEKKEKKKKSNFSKRYNQSKRKKKRPDYRLDLAFAFPFPFHTHLLHTHTQ